MERPAGPIACINRCLGSGRRYWVDCDNIERIGAMIVAARPDVPVIRRDRLARCEQGPQMRFPRARPLFTEIDAFAPEEICARLRSVVARHGDQR